MSASITFPHPESARQTLLANRTSIRHLGRMAITMVCLVSILIVAAALRFYRLGADSVGNQYYAATVQSMLTSPSNFFFGAFEPGGSVTVDKPPLGFWVQAVSAAIFGVNGFALALPQALAGVLSVGLLFYLVRRSFGMWAGLLAALTLAITPVAVSTERNNTIDGLLVFVLLLATWAFVKASERGRWRYVLLGAFLVGLGFNIKMLQAYLPLPALYAFYLLAGKTALWRKMLQLTVTTVLLLVVSLSWAVVVDLMPPESRPYIGSRTNNTVMELIVGHNGLLRLLPGGLRDLGDVLTPNNDPQLQLGQPPQSGQLPQSGQPPQPGQAPQPGQLPQLGQAPQGGAAPQPGQPPPQFEPGPQPGQPPQSGLQPGGQGQPLDEPQQSGVGGDGPGSPGAGISSEIGEPGLLRLFEQPLVDEASWLLPLAALGGLLALFVDRVRWPLYDRHGAILLWGGWLGTNIVFFSFANLFHAYYLIMLAPAIAALAGIGVVSLWRMAAAGRRLVALGLIFTLLLTAAFQIWILQAYGDLGKWLSILILGCVVVGLGGFLLGRIVRAMFDERAGNIIGGTALALGVGGVLLAPLVWSRITAGGSFENVNLPNAGPLTSQSQSQNRSPGGQGRNQLESPQADLIAYLTPLTADVEYLVGVLSAREASPLILETGRPVLAMGGFSGGDPIFAGVDLTAMVDNDALHYLYISPNELQQRQGDLWAWVGDNCQSEAWPCAEAPGAGNQPSRGGLADTPTDMLPDGSPPNGLNAAGRGSASLFVCGS